MNEFDFFVITARTTRKRDFLKAGVPPEKIRGEVTWLAYGRKKYPRTEYVVSLDFVSAVGQPGDNMTPSEKATAIALEWQAKGLPASVKYIPVD
ncbi:MAG: hypothetical protein KGL63_13585 [Betaproteobacteria bacterium]|jgi:hypothetical protein|nr:hypothetical protein [Betaproteobacteria bacterium]